MNHVHDLDVRFRRVWEHVVGKDQVRVNRLGLASVGGPCGHTRGGGLGVDYFLMYFCNFLFMS